MNKRIACIILAVGALLLIMAITAQVLATNLQSSYEEYMGYKASFQEIQDMLNGAKGASAYFGMDFADLIGIPKWQLTASSLALSLRVPLFVVAFITLIAGVIVYVLGMNKNRTAHVPKERLVDVKEAMLSMKDKLPIHQNKCASCGGVIIGKVTFCPKCGSKVPEKPVVKKIEKKDICVQCGNALEVDAKFCPECGAAKADKKDCPTTVVCSNCNAVLDSDTKFCKMCGTRVSEHPEVANTHCNSPRVHVAEEVVKETGHQRRRSRNPETIVPEMVVEEITEPQPAENANVEEKKPSKWMKKLDQL